MSRITKWKLEKAKVKVVFRLQFHATHIPQSGWDKLFISFIPTESGKIIAKTSKANVRNGTCKWADPIYETTRLLIDSKSKLYDEKLYKLVVGMGTSRSSILGEATINLADYADALKPSAVALPLHGSDHGTILHVTVQLLTAKTGFREFEQQRDRGLQSSSNVNREHESSTARLSSSELQISNEQLNKVNTRIQLRVESKELPSLVEETGIHEEYSDSQVGCDGSSNASESFYADKHDSSSTHELDSLKSTVSGDLNGPAHSQSPPTQKGGSSDHRISGQGSAEWGQGSSSDYSMDNDLAIAYEENHRLKKSLEVAESSISDLKQELTALKSHADEMSTETQKFAEHLTAEIASGQELAKEVMVLKTECSKFKEDLEKLKDTKSSSILMKGELYGTEHHPLPDKQLRWVNGLLLVEGRIRELQEKIYIGFHESNLSFIHSDLEMLLDIVQDLKKGTAEELPLQHKALELNMLEPEGMLDYGNIANLAPREPGSTGAADLIGGKHLELLSRLDEAKAERESLTRKMDQMECYYEALVQELEENQKRILGEFQSLRDEHSTCVYTISTCKAEADSLRHDMNDQILKFAEERHDLSSLNKELERRAMTAESSLKRARLNYSIAVGQLQKDLDMLSFQVMSMFETNQNLIKEAFSETSHPFSQGYPNTVDNLQRSDDALVPRIQSKQLLGGNVLTDDLKKSLSLQENLYQKVEEELCEMCLQNLYLDVYSGALKETLFEANVDIRKMKEKLDEFAQQLKLSNQSRDLLFTRLQTAVEDVQVLNEQNVCGLAKFHDVQLQNQILEANLGRVSQEKFLLMEKITECEALLMDYRIYRRKYEAASAEKLELENLLEVKVLDNENMEKIMFSVQEELETLRSQFHEMAISNEHMQKVLNFLREKFGSLLASCGKQLGEQLLFQDMDFKDIECVVLQLEEAQKYTGEKIIHLTEQKKDLENERDVAALSLSSARSEIDGMRRKFKQDIHDMAAKIDISNAFVEKLQLQLESVTNKFKSSLELEESHTQHGEALLAYLDSLELELQKISSTDKLFAQQILDLDTMVEEFERSRLTISVLMQEKQDLMMSLQNKTDESSNLLSELDRLKECLRCVNDDLDVEKGLKVKLEDMVASLTSQLHEKHDKLQHLDSQTSELVHFRQLASERESENSRVRQLLLQHEESLEKLCLEHSSIASLDCQLAEMQEIMIGEDVKHIFVKTQYETRIEELVQQLEFSDAQLKELEKKHLDIGTRLNRALASEAHFMEENKVLSTMLESLKSELEASVAQTVVISDSNDVLKMELQHYKEKLGMMEVSSSEENNQHAVEVSQLKDMLAKSEAEVERYRELQKELLDTEVRLNNCLESEARYVGENEKLVTDLTSLRSELEASIAQNAVISESNNALKSELQQFKDKVEMLEIKISEEKNKHAVEVGQMKNMLVESEAEVAQFRELEMKLLDTEKRLSHCLESEARYVEESEKLVRTINFLRSELEASIAQNAVISESNNVLTVELSQFKDRVEMLEVGLSEKSNEHALEVGQMKDMLAKSQTEVDQCREFEMKLLDTEKRLNQCLESEARHIEENVNLETTLKSLRSELEASVARNAVLSESNNALEQYKDRVGKLDDSLAEVNNQHALEVGQLKDMLAKYEADVGQLNIKLLETEERLNHNLEREARYVEENEKLSTTLESYRSELEAAVAQNLALSDSNNVLTVELEQNKNRVGMQEVGLSEEENKLKDMLSESVAEVDSLLFSKEVSEIIQIVLKAKLDECNGELIMLRNKCRELLNKLSEQILKTEEFKNLSIYLKELKDTADAAREKREPEGPSESLRIAFIKEQYEAKLQELKQQLSVSKRHGEEMLFKLQDALDETERRKKSEASHLKRNEELSLKITELEAELQSLNAEKPDYDRIQAELECTHLSLECCKEEKEKLVASLQECEEEKSKIAIELSLIREQLAQKEQNGVVYKQRDVQLNGSVDDKEVQYASSTPIGETGHSNQGISESEGVHGIPEHASADEDSLLLSNSKQLTVVNDQLGSQHFKSCMDQLDEELERMKNENSLLPLTISDPSFQDLQRELGQLHKVNQELRSIYPYFNDFPGNGNALERVLALEIELAEALRTKKKSSIQFQSSFLKQHSDEEAVFKSFRDINELIKDMLEIKGKYVSVETELKEMHDRYSQLSLQFAEVEGERQKLLMTLKNVRSSRNLLRLNRTSSATLEDHAL